MTVFIFGPIKYVNYLSKIHLFMKIIPHERTQQADPSEARVSASYFKMRFLKSVFKNILAKIN